MSEINNCMNCGTEQQLVNVAEFYCERCGAKNTEDGWYEQPNQYESERRQDFYDNGQDFRDKQSFERDRNRH